MKRNNWPLFIARRIYRDKNGGKRVSRPAVLISILGIAIGLAVMIISVSIIIGFKTEIKNKIVGFGSHIQMRNLDGVRSYETHPIAADDSLIKALTGYPEVSHIQRFTTKPGMIKTDDAFQGMVLKGVGPEYDLSFFREHLVEGEIPQFSDTVSSNSIVISQTLSSLLNLSVGDRIYTYFIQDNVRARRLTITGIYETNFSEFDKLFILTDLHTVTRLNNWEPDQVSGIEILLHDYGQLEETTYRIAHNSNDKTDPYGETYFVLNVEQLNPQIFGWLDLLDLNVWVILILMVGIAGFTMISGLLILIIERTNMIGMLKAMGASDFSIRKVFLWLSVLLISRGMIWGNVAGLLLYFLQSRFHLISLDPKTYYVDTVPVSFNLWLFLLLNAGTLIISVLMLIGPSFLISRINPATSIRYE